jgi:hypothetical protein
VAGDAVAHDAARRAEQLLARLSRADAGGQEIEAPVGLYPQLAIERWQRAHDMGVHVGGHPHAGGAGRPLDPLDILRREAVQDLVQLLQHLPYLGQGPWPPEPA